MINVWHLTTTTRYHTDTLLSLCRAVQPSGHVAVFYFSFFINTYFTTVSHIEHCGVSLLNVNEDNIVFFFSPFRLYHATVYVYYIKPYVYAYEHIPVTWFKPPEVSVRVLTTSRADRRRTGQARFLLVYVPISRLQIAQPVICHLPPQPPVHAIIIIKSLITVRSYLSHTPVFFLS